VGMKAGKSARVDCQAGDQPGRYLLRHRRAFSITTSGPGKWRALQKGYPGTVTP
jgi:hypothetical protein